VNDALLAMLREGQAELLASLAANAEANAEAWQRYAEEQQRFMAEQDRPDNPLASEPERQP